MTNKSVMTFISVNKISVCLSVYIVTDPVSNAGVFFIYFKLDITSVRNTTDQDRMRLVADPHQVLNPQSAARGQRKFTTSKWSYMALSGTHMGDRKL